MLLRGVYVGLAVSIVSMIFFVRAVNIVFLNRQPAIISTGVFGRLGAWFLSGMGLGFVAGVVAVILLLRVLAYLFAA